MKPKTIDKGRNDKIPGGMQVDAGRIDKSDLPQRIESPNDSAVVDSTSIDWSGLHFVLQTGGNVFSPTSTSKFLIENAEIKPGDTVLDLGCGIGPIAIAAATKGAGKVYAVDIMPEACEYTKRNVEINGLTNRITVVCGDLFDPLGDKQFDVIIDDVSGMAEEVARLSGWYPPPIPTGGTTGIEPTVKMLQKAGCHLKQGGRLYFPVLSLCCYKEIIETAHKMFNGRVETILTKMIPFCDSLKQHIVRLRTMKREGLIDFAEKRTRCLWILNILKASKR